MPHGTSGLIQALRPGLIANDRLEISDNVWEGMRPHRAADDVVGGADVGHPVSQGLVDCVLECPAPACHRHHSGTQLCHPEAIQLLALGVHFAHVHDALKIKHGAGSGCGNAVLSGASLCDDPLLPKLDGEQGLPHRVVDLVRASVGQLLALEPDLGSATELGEALGVVDRSGSADEVSTEARQFGFELRIHLPLRPGCFQLVVSNHQGLRDEAAAEDAVVEVPLVGVLLLLLL
mmetsp:Transcript_28246/g.50486  ORF Transcript_28246/g.50486 Transcript_28246/m.50486 type:complete len:234 (-) Transcript_28246:940-1641(-)